MALALLLGTVSTAAVALTAAVYLRVPTHTLCPECGFHTDAVLPRYGPRSLGRYVRFRWCSACGWEGLGRAGPERIPGHPAAHVSGFRWRDTDRRGGFTFRWRPVPHSEHDAEPPSDPSGFRWGGPAHERVFRWREEP